MTTVLFCRADHPMGYGYAVKGETMGKAHGYVVIAVKCADDDEMARVRARLAHEPFHGLAGAGQYQAGHMGEWYGGRFDFVGVIDGTLTLAHYGEPSRFRSFGDNRFAGIFEAAEVLNP